jgi:hypothetical protein
MNRIQTYNDLVAEKEVLERNLMVLKSIVRQDIIDLKKDLRPVTQVLGFLGKITTKDRSNSLVTLGVDIIGDVVIKNFLLAKTGWITRMVLPYFIKNYSTKFLGEKGNGLIEKIARKFSA